MSERFLKESEALRDHIPLSFTLHHIGSTAIPGIWCKPVLDLLLELPEVDALDDHAERFEALGFEVMGEFGIARRRYYRKRDPESGERLVHLHAFATGDEQVRRHLLFRDYMRAHPERAQAYGALKRGLVAQHEGDPEAYIEGKAPFIAESDALAAAWAGETSLNAIALKAALRALAATMQLEGSAPWAGQIPALVQQLCDEGAARDAETPPPAIVRHARGELRHDLLCDEVMGQCTRWLAALTRSVPPPLTRAQSTWLEALFLVALFSA